MRKARTRVECVRAFEFLSELRFAPNGIVASLFSPETLVKMETVAPAGDSTIM